MHCLQDGIRPSKPRKPFNILDHSLDSAAFPLTSLVLGIQKRCSTSDSLVEFPCQIKWNFFVSLSCFRIISLIFIDERISLMNVHH